MKSRTTCWSLNSAILKRRCGSRDVDVLHTNRHAALDSHTNGPQWVGCKVGDVMSVMETACPFTTDPFLTQTRDNKRKTDSNVPVRFSFFCPPTLISMSAVQTSGSLCLFVCSLICLLSCCSDGGVRLEGHIPELLTASRYTGLNVSQNPSTKILYWSSHFILICQSLFNNRKLSTNTFVFLFSAFRSTRLVFRWRTSGWLDGVDSSLYFTSIFFSFKNFLKILVGLWSTLTLSLFMTGLFVSTPERVPNIHHPTKLG